MLEDSRKALEREEAKEQPQSAPLLRRPIELSLKAFATRVPLPPPPTAFDAARLTSLATSMSLSVSSLTLWNGGTAPPEEEEGTMSVEVLRVAARAAGPPAADGSRLIGCPLSSALTVRSSVAPTCAAGCSGCVVGSMTSVVARTGAETVAASASVVALAPALATSTSSS